MSKKRAVDGASNEISHSLGQADRVVMMTNGPKATIGEDIRIDLERPRDRIGLAGDSRYAAYRKRLLGFLFLKQRVRDPAPGVAH